MSADFSDVKIVHKFAIQRARAAVPVNDSKLCEISNNCSLRCIKNGTMTIQEANQRLNGRT